MSDIWNIMQSFNGKTLHTIARQKPFRVSILPDRVQFAPERGSGTLRWISRKDIEYLMQMNLKSSEVTPEVVWREWPNDRNTSYVAAIIRELNLQLESKKQ